MTDPGAGDTRWENVSAVFEEADVYGKFNSYFSVDIDGRNPSGSEPNPEMRRLTSRGSMRNESQASSIETILDGEVPCIRLAGELDVSTVPELEQQVARQFEWGQVRIAFDLMNVTFLDSSILRILLGAHRRAHAAGGEVVLLCGPGFVRRLLCLLEIDRIVRVCDPEEWSDAAPVVN